MWKERGREGGREGERELKGDAQRRDGRDWRWRAGGREKVSDRWVKRWSCSVSATYEGKTVNVPLTVTIDGPRMFSPPPLLSSLLVPKFKRAQGIWLGATIGSSLPLSVLLAVPDSSPAVANPTPAPRNVGVAYLYFSWDSRARMLLLPPLSTLAVAAVVAVAVVVVVVCRCCWSLCAACAPEVQLYKNGQPLGFVNSAVGYYEQRMAVWCGVVVWWCGGVGSFFVTATLKTTTAPADYSMVWSNSLGTSALSPSVRWGYTSLHHPPPHHTSPHHTANMMSQWLRFCQLCCRHHWCEYPPFHNGPAPSYHRPHLHHWHPSCFYNWRHPGFHRGCPSSVNNRHPFYHRSCPSSDNNGPGTSLHWSDTPCHNHCCGLYHWQRYSSLPFASAPLPSLLLLSSSLPAAPTSNSHTLTDPKNNPYIIEILSYNSNAQLWRQLYVPLPPCFLLSLPSLFTLCAGIWRQTKALPKHSTLMSNFLSVSPHFSCFPLPRASHPHFFPRCAAVPLFPPFGCCARVSGVSNERAGTSDCMCGCCVCGGGWCWHPCAGCERLQIFRCGVEHVAALWHHLQWYAPLVLVVGEESVVLSPLPPSLPLPPHHGHDASCVQIWNAELCVCCWPQHPCFSPADGACCR